MNCVHGGGITFERIVFIEIKGWRCLYEDMILIRKVKKRKKIERKKEKNHLHLQANNILFTLFIKILKNTRKSFLPHKMKSPHQDH